MKGTMIPVTCGYTRVSKTDDITRNLETQFHILQQYGIRQEHIFSDEMSGSSMSRPAWNELMTRIRPNDTIVVVWLDRFPRNFEEGVRIQAELTRQRIGIISVKEDINTADASAAAKYFRRMMMVNGAYQIDATSERVKAGLDRAKAEAKRLGRPPALTPEQVQECRRMYAETPSIRRVARILGVSQGTVKRAVGSIDLLWASREQ